MYYIGVDIGGTFTDMVVMDEAGSFYTFKTLSTPDDLMAGIMDILELAATHLGIHVEKLLSETVYFAHGTTVATNTFIERKGAKTGLITTKGFRDTIFIQRMQGASAGLSPDEVRHYSRRNLPVPITSRAHVKEITERIDYKGSVIVPIDKEEARKVVRGLIDEGVQAIAVCFLWSFRNPSHEQEVKRIIAKEAPALSVTVSSDLLPVMGEYERTAATLVNSYLGLSIASYFGNFEKRLQRKGFKGTFSILTSTGGVFEPEEAIKKPLYLLNSGPVGGVLGSLHLGELLGYKNIITTDMGGTSFDVGLIVDGEPMIAPVSVVSKYHIAMPAISIESIGAGGGSIAQVDRGALKVGPLSAGSMPGPVCYGRGGTEPTVTDADIVLGFIDPDYFLGGRMKLNKVTAEEAIKSKIAGPLGISVIEAAAGIKTVTDNQMADLLRSLTIGRGHDPRGFVIFAYGGAGPSHCTSWGKQLNTNEIVIPLTATVHSAYGAVASDLHYSFELSDLMRTPLNFDVASKYLDFKRINDNFERLEGQGVLVLRKAEIEKEAMEFRRTVRMRYRRQTNEIEIPVSSGKLNPEDVDRLVERFEKTYELLYGEGTAFREAGIELTRLRLDAIGPIRKPILKKYPSVSEDPSEAYVKERRVYFPEIHDYKLTQIYDGMKLHAGNLILGPAIVQYPGTTAVVGPSQKGMVDLYLNLILKPL